ncbi:MAG: flagellar hook-basal body complex protein [Phycisphaeraceae bacterium]
MGLTTALYTALSGLTTNATLLSVAGNNISNINTTGFKASRMTFETQILQNLSPASAPTSNLGGTNPAQIGLGAREGTITRDFSNGSLQLTGVSTDMAIEGNGFFVVDVAGVRRFTRVGAFTLDSNFNLVNPDGGLVQGFAVDDDFNVIEGVVGNVLIPVGILTLAEATSLVRFTGNLNSGGDEATMGSITTSDPLYSDATQTTAAVAGDALATLFDNTGTALFAVGDVITVSGATKGGATLPDKTFEIGPANTTGSDDFGTTLQDFIDFLDDIMGLDTAANPSAGIAVSGAGEIVVTGNTGTVNNIALDTGDIVVNQTTTPTLPFDWTQTQDADGESVRTSFVAFDSLGTAMTIDMSFVLETKDNTGTTWRFYIQSEDDTDLDRVLGSGTVSFDTDGQFATATAASLTIDRNNTGAVTPQTISVSFVNPDGSISALESVTSVVNTLSQDGSAIGTLSGFTISEDGTIVGVFSNSLLRDLGRVVLAKFANPQGLVEVGANLFDVTANSGDPQIVSAGAGGAGRIVGGALELSNVELSEQFINLITATTGFSASSRVLSTSDRLVQELLAAIR